MNLFTPESIPFLALPWKRLEDRRYLPDCAAIYFVCDASSTVLYIGRTTNLFNRWAAHHRLSQFRKIKQCRIAWLTVTNSALLPTIEAACIEYFCPPWNGYREPGTMKSTTVTLYLDERIWRLFRVACLEQSTSASKAVEHFMRQSLTKKETPKGTSK